MAASESPHQSGDDEAGDSEKKGEVDRQEAKNHSQNEKNANDSQDFTDGGSLLLIHLQWSSNWMVAIEIYSFKDDSFYQFAIFFDHSHIFIGIF